MSKKLIKIAHSPDSDDAFMFYALKHGKVTSDKYDFQIERKDIEELNKEAQNETYDISAISMHAYAHLSDKYALTASGASMAEKDYGPMVIANEPFSSKDLAKKTVAVPGEWTTACLMLKIFAPQIKHRVVPFEKIMAVVRANQVDAGLIIHEGQLQYQEQGFHKILSLLDVWRSLSPDLPLPLGGNAVKKSLGIEVMRELSNLQKQSIDYAVAHPTEARDYAMQFKRDLSAEEADQYLSWYANDRTLDMGPDGRKAVELLISTAFDKGLLDKRIHLEIV